MSADEVNDLTFFLYKDLVLTKNYTEFHISLVCRASPQGFRVAQVASSPPLLFLRILRAIYTSR